MSGGQSLITTGIFTKITAGFVRVIKYSSGRHTSPCKCGMEKNNNTWYKDDKNSSFEAKNSKYK